MSFWWIVSFLLVWSLAGCVRVITLLGHKKYKETLLDKVLMTGALPVAFIMGFITYLSEKFSKNDR